MRTRVPVQSHPQRPCTPVDLPVLAQETPLDQDEMRRRVAEAEQLEEAGRSPQSLPSQQLAQMAAKAGPSMSGGDKPTRKKLHPTMGGKAPRKEFLTAGKLKRPKSTNQGLWLLMRYASFKRAQSSSSGNITSHG